MQRRLPLLNPTHLPKPLGSQHLSKLAIHEVNPVNEPAKKPLTAQPDLPSSQAFELVKLITLQQSNVILSPIGSLSGMLEGGM